jgi:NADH-quinone oxidoreductase subunit J
MTAQDIVMLGIAVIGGASALLVVTARNVVHAALYLVVTLLSVAGTFLLLGAEFLAWSQVLVYVGAVVILILFGLMLTRAPIGPMAQHTENRRMAFGVSVALFVFLTTMIVMSFGTSPLTLTHTRTVDLGSVLYTQWAFPFMVLGFFLTVALIGAIVIARREVGEGPQPPEEDQMFPADRREPAPSDATGTPGVTTPAAEVEAR